MVCVICDKSSFGTRYRSGGLHKKDVRQFLYQRRRVPEGLLERYLNNSGLNGNRPDEHRWTLYKEARKGRIPIEYCELDRTDCAHW